MKRKLIAATLAASLASAATAPAYAVVVVAPPPPPPVHHVPHTGPWIVGGIVCAALGPILTTLIVNRQLTADEAVMSMLFCFPPGLYGAILQSQGKSKKR
jgi:hypothetical protein